MRFPVAVAVLALLLAPTGVSAQEKSYNFTWASYAEGHSTQNGEPVESGARDGWGLASIQSSADGSLRITFGGPGGTGSAFVESEQNQSGPRCAVAHITFPVRVGTDEWQGEAIGCYNWSGSFAAPDAFVLTARTPPTQGGFVDLDASGSASPGHPIITSPTEGAPVNGIVPVAMKLEGLLPGTPVVFRLAIDGADVFSQPASASGTATYTWDTRSLATGSRHTLAARITTGAGQLISQAPPRTVIVSSSGGSTPPPPSLKVVLTSPQATSTVAGAVTVNIWVEGASAGSNTFVLEIDGRPVTTQSCSCTHVWPSWNTRLSANGTHTVRASVGDSAGKTGSSANLTVIVQNP
jgi:hypothetical protein